MGVYTGMKDIVKTHEPNIMYGGYISPEGDYYPCPYGGHRPLIKALSKKFGPIDDMAKSWVHISHEGDTYVNYLDYKITQAQAGALISLACVEPHEIPEFIKDWPRFNDVDIYRVADPKFWKNSILSSVFMSDIIELGRRLTKDDYPELFKDF